VIIGTKVYQVLYHKLVPLLTICTMVLTIFTMVQIFGILYQKRNGWVFFGTENATVVQKFGTKNATVGATAKI